VKLEGKLGVKANLEKGGHNEAWKVISRLYEQYKKTYDPGEQLDLVNAMITSCTECNDKYDSNEYYWSTKNIDIRKLLEACNRERSVLKAMAGRTTDTHQLKYKKMVGYGGDPETKKSAEI
jgi:hypothetical protein